MPQHGPQGNPHGLLTQRPNGGPGAAPAGRGPAPVPQAQVPVQSQGQREDPNVSPEEQKSYDQFVDNALSAIYDEKSLPQIIQSLRGDGNPMDGLANTVVNIVMRVKSSAEQAGQEISDDILLAAGGEIIEDLAGLAATAGVHEYTPEEIEGAFFQSMDIYREMTGRDGGQNREQIVQDMNQLNALDEAGRLDEVAPGLSAQFPPIDGPRAA